MNIYEAIGEGWVIFATTAFTITVVGLSIPGLILVNHWIKVGREKDRERECKQMPDRWTAS